MNTSKIERSFIYKKIIWGAIGTLGLRVTTTALNLIIAILLARFLGTAEYGQYTLVMTVIGFLAIPTTLGLPNLIVRLVAAYEVKKQWALLKGIIGFSHITVILLSLLFSLAAYLLAGKYKAVFNMDNSEVFVLAIIMLPFMSIIAVQGAVMRGFHQTIKGQFSGTLFKSLLFFICVVAISYLNVPEALHAVMMAQVGCVFVAFIMSSILMRTSCLAELINIKKEMAIGEWVKSALPLLFMGGVQIVNQQTDILMTAHYLNDSAVGIYQVSLKFSELTVFLLMAVNLAISPMISSLHQQGKLSELQDLMTRSARYISLFTIPIVLLLLFIGEKLIALTFGELYVEANTPLMILLIGQCMNVLVGSVGVLLIMTGYEKLATIGLVVSACANVLLNVLLIPEYGIVGAAIATTLSMVIWNLLMSWFSVKKVSINCSVIRFSKNNKLSGNQS